MKTYIISDLHFFHEAIIEYCDRPFRNSFQMTEAMILRWNEVVTDEDVVIVAGDFSFGNKEKIKEVLSRLNGKKILIKGNHDRHGAKFYLEVGFSDFFKHSIVLHDGIVVSHHPLKRKDNEVFYNIHGHVHNSIDIIDEHHFNVSAEVLNYYPIDVNAIRKYFGNIISQQQKEDITASETEYNNIT